MSCISRRKRAPSKATPTEELEMTTAAVVRPASGSPSVEVNIPAIGEGEGQLVIHEAPSDNKEIRELKRELAKMQKEHVKQCRELNLLKNTVAAYRCELKNTVEAYRCELKEMKDTSYEGEFIWRLTPASEILVEPPEHANIPDAQYYGFHVNSPTFYSSRYAAVYDHNYTHNYISFLFIDMDISLD